MIGAVIQARMGSSRLPGKVLQKIDSKTLLEFQINRIQHASKPQKIIVATDVPFLETHYLAPQFLQEL